MAKLDTTFASLEEGFQNPMTTLTRLDVQDQYMETVGVRRKSKSFEVHKLWCLSVGETGATPASFYGHNPTECIRKALEWRGLPTVTRGPRKG